MYFEMKRVLNLKTKQENLLRGGSRVRKFYSLQTRWN